MPFMKGRAPVRRTMEYLNAGRLVLKDKVRIFSVNYNTYGEHHVGARDFVFWNIPQVQFKNPQVQVITFKNMSPSPFIRCYFDDGRDMLVDIDSKNRHEIMDHLLRVLGKTKKQLDAEARATESKDNPANFGYGCNRHCICEIPGQVPCPGTVRLPDHMRELLSDQGLRLDGRRPNELRRIRCKLGVFEQPDGSAYLEQGNTKVLAAVYGPHQAQSKKVDFNELVINCQYSMATFSTAERKNRPRGDRKSQEITLYLRQSLKAGIRTELYPRSQIDVYVEVLQADGANFAVALNAATLALVDAGICLEEYVVACTASLSKNNVPLMDVSNFEEVSGGPTLTVASLPLSNKIAFMEMSQRFHLEHLPKVLEHSLNGCRKIQAIMENAVRKHLMQIGSVGDWNNIVK